MKTPLFSLSWQRILLFVFLTYSKLISANPAQQQLDFTPSDVVAWHVIDALSYDDANVIVRVNLQTQNKFGLYSDKITLTPVGDLFFSHMIQPKTAQLKDPISKKMVEVFYQGEFILVFKGLSPYEQETFDFTLTYVGCNHNICLFPYDEKLSVKVTKVPGTIPSQYDKIKLKIPSTNQSKASLKQQATPSSKVLPKQQVQEQTTSNLFLFNQSSFKDLQQEKSFKGLLIFLLFLLFAGLITNFTPCVYPMIPITIRILGQQSKHPLVASSVYALGIMTTYTALGVFAAMSGSLFGSFMANTYVNLFLALMMAFFGFSMIGYGNYSSLQNLGNRLSAHSSGLKSCYLMGLSAGLVASPCTGPVLAALLTYSLTAQENPGVIVLYLAIYSLGFSLPYILLGNLASRITKIKLRPSLQIVVKIAFASIMFALSFNYLRVPFYETFHKLSSHWQAVALTGFVLFLTFFYLLGGKKRFWPRVFSLIFLGFALFSVVQLITSNPKKELIVWSSNEAEVIELAKRNNKPVLIDMWAEWCELCKKMNRTTFQDPKVVASLKSKGWGLLKLDLTKMTDASDAYRKKYGIKGLPALVILLPGQEKGHILNGFIDSSELLGAIELYSKKVIAQKKD